MNNIRLFSETNFDDPRFVGCSLDQNVDYWVMNTTTKKRIDAFGLNMPSPDKIKKILEIGCSYGETTLRLSEKYPDADIVAVDIDKLALEIARGYASKRIQFLHADGYYPSRFCNAESKDLVLMMNNLANFAEEVEKNKLAEIFEDICSVTSPKGYLVVSNGSSYIIAKKEENRFNIISRKLFPSLNNEAGMRSIDYCLSSI